MNINLAYTASDLLTMAINMANIEIAKIIANSPEYTAEIDAQAAAAIIKPVIDTTAADNASKRSRFDYEGAILARQERMFFSSVI